MKNAHETSQAISPSQRRNYVGSFQSRTLVARTAARHCKSRSMKPKQQPRQFKATANARECEHPCALTRALAIAPSDRISPVNSPAATRGIPVAVSLRGHVLGLRERRYRGPVVDRCVLFAPCTRGARGTPLPLARGTGRPACAACVSEGCRAARWARDRVAHSAGAGGAYSRARESTVATPRRCDTSSRVVDVVELRREHAGTRRASQQRGRRRAQSSS